MGEEILPENFLEKVFFSQEIFDPSNPKISWKNFLVRNGLRDDPRSSDCAPDDFFQGNFLTPPTPKFP